MAFLRSGRVRAADGGFIGLRETERYLGNPVSDGYILLANTDGVRSWVDPTTVVSSINVLEEATPLGSFSDLKFLSSNLTAVGSGSTAEISLTDDPVFTTLEVNGATLGTRTVSSNIFFGVDALNSSVTGINNVAIGVEALNTNTGNDNIAIGYRALYNTTGANNIGIGYRSLEGATGLSNTGVGYWSLRDTTSGSSNSALGNDALFQNISGEKNVAIGKRSGGENLSGDYNTYLGAFNGLRTNRSRSVIIGSGDISGVNPFPVYGFDAPKDADNQLAIGQRIGSGAASYWIVGDENYNIGIGTTNPTVKLDVEGDVRFPSLIYDSTGSAGVANYVIASGGPGTPWTWKLVTDAGAGQLDAIIVQNDGSNVGAAGTNSELHFWGNFDIIQSPSVGIASIRLADTLNIGGLNVSGVSTFQDNVNIGVGGTTAFFDVSTGRFGIGTNNPTALLNVYGTTSPYILVEDGSPTDNQARINFKSPSYEWTTGLHGGESGKYKISYASAHGTNDYLTITTSGNVGIGTIDPSQPLDVNGNVRFRGAIYDNNNVDGGVNQVLISTGVGVSWADITDIDELVDATTLDGLDSEQFLRSDVADTKVGITTFEDNIHLLDNDRLQIGGSSGTFDGFELYHDGSNSFISDTGTGSLEISSTGFLTLSKSVGGEKYIVCDADAEVALYYDDSKKFETTGAGVTVFGTTETQQLNVTGVSTFQDNVNLGDNDRLRLGDSQDLQIWHSGSNSIIQDNGTGNLFLQGSNSVRITDLSSNEMAVFVDGGAVELYNNADKKFETTGAGVTVFGTTESQQLNVSGVSTFQDDVNIGVGGTTAFFDVSTGRLLVGTNVSASRYGVESRLQISGTTTESSSISLSQTAQTAESPGIYFWGGLVRNDTYSQGLIQFGGVVGGVAGQNNIGATIEAITDGVAYSGGDQTDLPTSLILSTTPDGSGSPIERFRIKPSGNVGIGTDNPAFPLTVSGANATVCRLENTSSTTAFLTLEANNTTQPPGMGASANDLVFNTSFTEQVRIKSSGLVGIGTNNPVAKLDVLDNDIQILVGDISEGTSSTDGGVRFNGIGTTIQSAIFTEVNGEILSYGINVGQISTTGLSTDRVGGIFRLDTRTGSAFGDSNNFVVKGRSIGTTVEHDSIVINLDTGETSLSPDKGNVGIGTNSASQLLDVNGNARFRGAVYDNNNVVGGANSVFVSTGSGVVWADITTIPVGDAQTLDGLDSTQFLRSDVADTKTGITTFNGQVYLQNSNKVTFGLNSSTPDLEIWHNSSGSNRNNYIDGNTKNLYIRNNVDNDGTRGNIVLQATSGENSAIFVDNAGVLLYYDNSKKFETTTTGIAVSNGASTSATIAGPDEIIIDPATVGDNTGSVRIKGDLYVDGTTTQINSTTIELADFIVGIATTATTDTLADGAGIQIGPDNTFLYEYNSGTNPSLKSSENLNVASGKHYQIGETEVLNATTLGSGVVNSSLTSVGTLTGLTVSGDVSIADKIIHTGDTNTAIRFPAVDTFTVETAGAERVRITDIGRVGINTTAPSQTLDVNGNVRFRNALYDNTNSDGDPNQILSSTGSGIAWITASSAASGTEILSQQASTPYYITASDVTSGVSTAGFIDTTIVARDGKIGVGINNPGAKLDVYGTARIGGTSASDRRADFDTNGRLTLSYGDNSNNSVLTLDNTNTAASTGHGANILWQFGTNASSTPIGAGRIDVIKEQQWTSTSSTQDSALAINLTENGSLGEKVRITSAGNVGIGSISPSAKLAIRSFGSDHLRIEDNVGDGYNIFRNTTGGFLEFEGTQETFSGFIFWTTPTGGSTTERMRINSAGNVGIGTDNPGYKLEVNGSFAATTKSFVIDHPTKEGMKLRYGSLEGPENGVYVRGRLNGNNTIELPDYWTGLVDEETITVNLTPIGRNASLHSVIDIVDNTVVVESASGEVNCFYTVFGERKDTERFEVEF